MTHAAAGCARPGKIAVAHGGRVRGEFRAPCQYLSIAAVLVVLCTGCGGDASGADAGQDIDEDGGLDGSADKRDAPPSKDPATTVTRRINGVLPATRQPERNRKLWGLTQPGPGEPHQRLDLLQVSTAATTPSGPSASLLYFAQLSDLHLMDEESPARAPLLDDGEQSWFWRAQEAYTPLVVDAIVRKLGKLHAVTPLDFVLMTGDLVDNAQKNELEWFVTLMAGGTVVPNSAKLEDPVAGPSNDPHDAFAALGLGDVPWYALGGNHDHLVHGDCPLQPLLGTCQSTGDPTRGSVDPLDTGRVNTPACLPLPANEAALPWRCIPTPMDSLSTGALPADAHRVHLGRDGWFRMLEAAGGLPKGHGLSSGNVASAVGDYVVDPLPGVPLRLIALDTVAPLGVQGTYDRLTSFLEPTLEQAQKDAVLVIVASHHPSSEITNGSELVQLLGRYPNVILHLVGHGHVHRVSAHPARSAPFGYWEVETASLIDWPQQGRLVELVDKRDGTVELWLTVFDYDTDHRPLGTLVEGARFLALQEMQSGAFAAETAGSAIDRNVILPVAIPAAVSTKLAKLAGRAPVSGTY